MLFLIILCIFTILYKLHIPFQFIYCLILCHVYLITLHMLPFHRWFFVTKTLLPPSEQSIFMCNKEWLSWSQFRWISIYTLWVLRSSGSNRYHTWVLKLLSFQLVGIKMCSNNFLPIALKECLLWLLRHSYLNAIKTLRYKASHSFYSIH